VKEKDVQEQRQPPFDDPLHKNKDGGREEGGKDSEGTEGEWFATTLVYVIEQDELVTRMLL
jgi:hypothetical protein